MADGPPTPADAEPAPPRRPRLDLAGKVNFWSTAITAVTAILALILSVVTYTQLNSSATIGMTMPKTIRLWAMKGWLQVVIGPTFSVDKKTELASTVTDAEISIKVPDGNGFKSIKLDWFENVSLPYSNQELPVKIEAEAAPFDVTSEGSITTLMQFRTHSAAQVGVDSGTWDATLAIKKAGQEDLVQNFCIVVEPDGADFLTKRLTGVISVNNIRLRYQRDENSSCYRTSDRFVLPNPPG